MQQQTTFSIPSMGKFLNISAQTLRKKLQTQGYLKPSNKVGNQYLLTFDDAESFIAKNYGIYYNEFVNKYSLGKRNEDLMFTIPKGKGVISSDRQRSGKVLYYIRNLPLYTDDQGNTIKFRSKGYTTKEEAIAERERLLSDRENGLYKYHYLEVQQKEKKSTSIKKAPTYYEFCVKYFEAAEYEEATRELYLDITENRFKPFFKDIPVTQLTKALLQEFVDQYNTNIRKMFIVLSLTLKKLYSLDLIKENFYTALIKPKSIAPKHPKEALSVDETKQFLQYFKGHTLEHCIRLLFQCGLRIGELLALQWHEVELISASRARIHVNASWGKTVTGMGRKAPKTASSKRIIPINDAYTVQTLISAKKRSKSCLWVAENQSGTRPIDKHNFSKRYFTKVGNLLGFKKHLSSHVARHTFISHMVQNNVPYTEIAKLAGHDSTAMIINVYAHAIQEEEQVFDYVSNMYA